MEISRNDEFGGAVLNCAVRYALGRISYISKQYNIVKYIINYI